MVRLRLAHLSGRYDRPAWLLGRQVRKAAKWADIITLTEVDRAERAKVLALPGWTLLRGPDGARGESAILVRDGMWSVKAWHKKSLDFDLDGMRGRQIAVIAVLVHKSGKRLLVTTTHTPSGVEADWDASLRAREYRLSYDNWRALVNEWTLRFKPDGVVVVGDMNLNVLNRKFRGWVREAWPELRLPWALPTKGTHGSRLIDWPLTSGLKRVRLRIQRKSLASDHRGIRITAEL